MLIKKIFSIAFLLIIGTLVANAKLVKKIKFIGNISSHSIGKDNSHVLFGDAFTYEKTVIPVALGEGRIEFLQGKGSERVCKEIQFDLSKTTDNEVVLSTPVNIKSPVDFYFGLGVKINFPKGAIDKNKVACFESLKTSVSSRGEINKFFGTDSDTLVIDIQPDMWHGSGGMHLDPIDIS